MVLYFSLSLLLCPLLKPPTRLRSPSPCLVKKGSGSHPDCGGIPCGPFLLKYKLLDPVSRASPGALNSLLLEGCSFPLPAPYIFSASLSSPPFFPAEAQTSSLHGQVLATSGLGVKSRLSHQDTLHIHHLFPSPLNCLHTGLHNTYQVLSSM